MFVIQFIFLPTEAELDALYDYYAMVPHPA